MIAKKNERRGAADVRVIVIIAFLVVLLMAAVCFGIKFYELYRVARDNPDGAFAVTPIVNYLMAGLGFLCMFGWAAFNGMFHDIEQPKRTMLENEQRLDAAGKPFSLWEE